MNRRLLDRLELGGALLTGALHLALTDGGVRVPFIALAGSFWYGYAAWRGLRDPSAFRRWGFRRKLLGGSTVPAIAIACGTAGSAAWGWYNGNLLLPPYLPLLIAGYSLWGIVQQFLVQALIVARLPAIAGVRRRPLLTLIGALLFALVHYPDPLLSAATFLLGLVFVPVYLEHRNLWPLGVAHGWLGTFFYLWVLGRDPWVEAFGNGCGQ